MGTRTRTMTLAVLVASSASLLLPYALEVRAQGGAQPMTRDRKPLQPAPALQNDEEARLQQALAADPSNVEALRSLAAYYNRTGRFELAIKAVERVAALRPADAEAHHVVGSYYFEKSRDPTLSAATKQTYIERGMAAEDDAIAINPEYLEALVYKSLFLRLQAVSEPDPVRQQALVREADALRGKALQLQKSRPTGAVPPGTVIAVGSAPPPPPPPSPPGAPPASEMKWVYGNAEYSVVSGRRPVKTRDVRPIYPPMAISGGIEGTVILEATVDGRGRVAEVKVVESVSLLTQSTIDAVRQWEFDPGSLAVDASTVISVSATFKRTQ
jgi:TonB family protein